MYSKDGFPIGICLETFFEDTSDIVSSRWKANFFDGDRLLQLKIFALTSWKKSEFCFPSL